MDSCLLEQDDHELGEQRLRSSIWIDNSSNCGNDEEEEEGAQEEELMEREEEEREEDPWNSWNQFRTLCEQDPGLSVVLELGRDAPSSLSLDRWCGEPVKAIIIPTSVFLTNPAGRPVLSRAHQRVLLRFMELGAQVILRGRNHHGAHLATPVTQLPSSSLLSSSSSLPLVNSSSSQEGKLDGLRVGGVDMEVDGGENGNDGEKDEISLPSSSVAASAGTSVNDGRDHESSLDNSTEHLISPPTILPSPTTVCHDLSAYQAYLHHLMFRVQQRQLAHVDKDKYEQERERLEFEAPYRDFLQAPVSDERKERKEGEREKREREKRGRERREEEREERKREKRARVDIGEEVVTFVLLPSSHLYFCFYPILSMLLDRCTCLYVCLCMQLYLHFNNTSFNPSWIILKAQRMRYLKKIP